MFRRRERRGPLRIIAAAFYPPGGWRRALSYIAHRLRRLPDTPGRIARGAAAGVFVTFTPFFGLHFLAAAVVAWLVRGNIIAALLGTFVGNPFTFPIIAASAIELGAMILGHGELARPVLVAPVMTRERPLGPEDVGGAHRPKSRTSSPVRRKENRLAPFGARLTVRCSGPRSRGPKEEEPSPTADAIWDRLHRRPGCSHPSAATRTCDRACSPPFGLRRVEASSG